MGCGASAQKAAQVEKPSELNKQGSSGKERHRERQKLQKVDSKLGSRRVVNSFTVVHSRESKRVSETNNAVEGIEREKSVTRPRKGDSNGPSIAQGGVITDAAGFQLPDERTAGPEQPGVRASAPSFKAPKNLQAELLRQLGTTPEETATGDVDDEGQGEQLNFQVLRAHLDSSDDGQVLQAAIKVRVALSAHNPATVDQVKNAVQQVRDAGLIPLLVKLLQRDDNNDLQYEASWALTNVCSGTHEDCQDVVDQGVIPQFIRLLASCGVPNVVEQVIWGLGNIAADCRELQGRVLKDGVVDPLLAAIDKFESSSALVRNALWLLSNLARPKPQNKDLLNAIPKLAYFLETATNEELLTHACWSMAYISCDDEACAALMQDYSHLVVKLVAWVSSDSPMSNPALRTVGNLCSGSADMTQAVVEASGVPAIVACLTRADKEQLKKETLWALSNIAAGTSEQVQALLEAGVFPVVIRELRAAAQNKSEGLLRECTYVLSNPWAPTVKATEAVAKGLLAAGVVEELSTMLSVETPDQILVVAVEGLYDAIKKGQQMMMWEHRDAPPPVEGEEPPPPPQNRVALKLKELGAYEKLQMLTHHGDPAVSQKANGICSILSFV